MIKFKDLFKFSKKEISSFFNKSKIKARFNGLKFLVVEFEKDEPKPEFGKLLIVTPRACGKASVRNKLRRRLKNIFYTKQLYKYPKISIIIATNKSTLLQFEQLQNFLVSNIFS